MKKETKTTKTAAPQTPEPTAPEVNSDEAYDWSQESSTGFEGTRAEDMGIPFLSMLQKGSPEVDEDHKDYATKGIPDAEAGMIMNTVTRQIVYNKSEGAKLLFVPAFHQKLYQEWKPRNKGGGFVMSHPTPAILTQCSRNEKNTDVLPNGNEVKTTSYFYGFALIENSEGNFEWVRCIIPFVSTQLKKARGWLNLMHGIRIGGIMPPMFSHAYALTSVKEANESGSWYGWEINLDHALTKQDVGVIKEARQVSIEFSSQKQLPAAAPSAPQDENDDDAYAEAESRQNRNR